MTDLDVLREAVPDVPAAPPMSELRRRVRRRQVRRRVLGALPLVVVAGLVGGLGLRQSQDRVNVAAQDPLALALAPYSREVVIGPATDDVPGEPPDAEPSSRSVVGILNGALVQTFTHDADGEDPSVSQAGYQCVRVEPDFEHCRPPRTPLEPMTSAVGRHLVWVNVPSDAVAVGLVASDGTRWQRPFDGFAYFPLASDETWRQFEIKAFDSRGRVLASEMFRSGQEQHTTWLDASGTRQERRRTQTNTPTTITASGR